MSPIDFYFWGMLKAKVYHQFIPATCDSLKEKIIEEVNKVSLEEICSAVHNLEKRCECVVSQNGGHFEHIL